jgi:2-oxoglutarate dehydrogenase complex dehydrogenase (E1) component-like enzyme
MHLPNKHEREWIAKTLETLHSQPVSVDQRLAQWRLLERSESFDRFLHVSELE